MSTEITWKNLSKAGFKKTDLKKWQKDNVTIETNRGSICERPFICYVYTGDNRFVKASFNSIKGTIKTRVPRHTGVNDYWHHCTCKVTKKRTKKCRCGKIKVSWEIDNPA